jgi:hypothetical protein
MDLSLKNKEWKEFVFTDLFDFEKGSNKSLSNETSVKQLIDYVGATSRNNGNVGFVSKKYNQHLKKGNCLVFINTGEGSVGDAIYKKNSFIPSNNVTIGRSNFLNEYIGNFIVAIINNQSHKYSYGYIRNETRLKRDKILLPINSQGDPDYEFMENYMRAKEQEKINAYKNYISKRISELENVKEVVPLSEKDWGEFFLNDIFNEIQRGKRLKKDDHKKGRMPYVSSTAINNGIDGFVGNKEKVRIFSNCLSLANSGSVGSIFYESFEFVASDHVTKLENKDFSKSIYLFISTIISRLGEKYSFNREINDTRIKREKIMLPINVNHEPDYVYMENFMKQLELKKLKKYLEYKQ